MSSTPESALAGRYLVFSAAGREFAAPLGAVLEIVAAGPLTRLPLAPPHLRGVFDVRGRAVPVLDLSVRFGGGESEINSRTCIVLVERRLAGEPVTMGLVADGVSEVVEPGSAVLGPVPEEPPVPAPFLSGQLELDGRAVLVLNLLRVMAAPAAPAARGA